MSEKLFDENGVARINLQDYEIVHEPVPQNETPRQFVLRMTGKDLAELACNGHDLTWEDLKAVGALPFIERLVQTTTYIPSVKLGQITDLPHGSLSGEARELLFSQELRLPGPREGK